MSVPKRGFLCQRGSFGVLVAVGCKCVKTWGFMLREAGLPKSTGARYGIFTWDDFLEGVSPIRRDVCCFHWPGLGNGT